MVPAFYRPASDHAGDPVGLAAEPRGKITRTEGVFTWFHFTGRWIAAELQ